MGFLAGKRILVTGVLSNRSIAYGIARACHREGAELAFTYVGDRFRERTVGFAAEFDSTLIFPCDVASDDEIAALFTDLQKTWPRLDGLVHAIGFAPREAIAGDFVDGLSREGFRIAHDISAYSFPALAKAALPLLSDRASLLTLTYLGGQIRGSAFAADLYTYPSYFFGPPAGYTGSLPNGAPVFDDSQGDSALNTNANLYAAEFRTAAGPVTLNARYYVAGVNTANLNYGDGPTPGEGSLTGSLFGGVPIGTDQNPTVFNGQVGSVTLLNQYVGVRTYDKLNGFTTEADLPIANNVYSLSYDTVATKSSATTIGSTDTPINVPAGSGQKFSTLMVRGQFQLLPHLQATLSNYATSYTDHYSQDFGTTFLDSSHAYDAPRLSFAWRPNPNMAVRASTGFSIAPPYINLLTNSMAGPDRQPATYFTVTGNAGDVKPETAFGWDFGADRRLAADTVISADVYETTLHDQFLSTTSLSATPYILPANNPYASPAGKYPLYVTQTANLGHSRYAGVELSVHRLPRVGTGFRLQGSLQRAYAYDLPPGFYDTASGKNTANLGVLPNENFQGAGQGYNSLSPSRVPYSLGYAELNHRWSHGAYFLLGITYFGNNNSYNEPPFGVVNTSFRQPIDKYASLLLAITNATSAYPANRFNIYGGIPTPLVNGQLGLTAGNVVGPSTASLTLHLDL